MVETHYLLCQLPPKSLFGLLARHVVEAKLQMYLYFIWYLSVKIRGKLRISLKKHKITKINQKKK